MVQQHARDVTLPLSKLPRLALPHVHELPVPKRGDKGQLDLVSAQYRSHVKVTMLTLRQDFSSIYGFLRGPLPDTPKCRALLANP